MSVPNHDRSPHRPRSAIRRPPTASVPSRAAPLTSKEEESPDRSWLHMLPVVLLLAMLFRLLLRDMLAAPEAPLPAVAVEVKHEPPKRSPALRPSPKYSVKVEEHPPEMLS